MFTAVGRRSAGLFTNTMALDYVLQSSRFKLFCLGGSSAAVYYSCERQRKITPYLQTAFHDTASVRSVPNGKVHQVQSMQVPFNWPISIYPLCPGQKARPNMNLPAPPGGLNHPILLLHGIRDGIQP
jgi:hypothetical protein